MNTHRCAAVYRSGVAIKAAFLYASVAIGLIVFFIGWQAGVLAITDNGAVAHRLQAAIDDGGITADNYPSSPYVAGGGRVDMYTECIALTTNLRTEGSLLKRVAASSHVRFSPNEVNPCPALVNTIRDGAAIERPYFRYWHGAQVYLRPALTLMPLQQIRALNAILLAAALLFFTVVLVRIIGLAAAPAFLIPFVVGTDLLTVPTTTVHSLSLAVNFLGAAVVGSLLNRFGPNSRVTLAGAIVAGGCSSFFDLLFNPPLAPALIAFVAIAAALRSDKPRGHAGWSAAVIVAFWFAGFLSAYAGKWFLAALVLGTDSVLRDVTYQILQRLNGEIGFWARDWNFPLGVALLNMSHVGVATLGTAWAIAAVVLALGIARGGRTREQMTSFALMLLPLLVPLVWVELVRNHSLIHSSIFVSRSFILFAVVPLLASLALWAQAQRAPIRLR